MNFLPLYFDSFSQVLNLAHQEPHRKKHFTKSYRNLLFEDQSVTKNRHLNNLTSSSYSTKQISYRILPAYFEKVSKFLKY